MADDYTIRTMSADDIARAVDWAAAEGWNPGLADAACFATVDRQGFIGGFLDGRMIAAISVVNYDDAFAFLGFYIVHPDRRGQGYGYRLWQAAVAHAGDRLIGLDGVVQEQETYKKSGFQLAYRNIRFGGRVATDLDAVGFGGWVSVGLSSETDRSVRIEPLHAVSPALEVFDRTVFPAPRRAFLDAWLGAEGHIARAAFRDGAFAGYGVLRPCRTGHKIGPLFADAPETARALIASLVGALPTGTGAAEIFLDVPEPNAAAMALAESLGLAPVFETARMYTGPVPAVDLKRVYGVTSFELG